VAELSTDQQKALALAAARKRQAEAGAEGGGTGGPLGPAIDVARYIDDLVRQAASGATAGYVDEASAALNTGAGLWGDYGAELEAGRTRDEQFRAENPVMATGAEIAGGVASAVAAAPAAAGIGGARALASVPNWMKLAGLGATGGAVAGFGQGEGGLGNRLESAGVGTVVGAGAGLLVPAVISSISRFGKRAVAPLMQRLGGQTPVPGLAMTPAIRQILVRLDRDQVTPDQAIEQLRQLGPEAGIADVGGENVLSLARGVAQRIPAREVATRFYADRNVGTGQRVLRSLLDGLTGGDPQFYQRIEQLSAQRRTAAAPLYEVAYQAPVIQSDSLTTLLNRPSMRDAMRRAQRIAAEEGRDPTQLGFDFNEAGDVIFTREPSWQTLDYVKRGLDDVLNAFRDSTTGKLRLDESGRAIDATRREFVAMLRSSNPAYAKALDAWAGPSQVMDMMDMGRQFVRGDADEVVSRWAQIPEQDRAFYRLGAAQELKAMIEGVADGRDLFNRLWGNEAMRRRLKTIFEDTGALEEFARTVTAEHAFRQNSNVVSPRAGSQTTPRLIDDAALVGENAEATGNALWDLLNLNMGTAARRTTNSLTRSLRERSKDATAEELAPLLFNRDPAANDRLLQLLRQTETDRILRQPVQAGQALGGGALLELMRN
jgi:hypothetical protein